MQVGRQGGFPRHRAAASLKRGSGRFPQVPDSLFSAASGRGLIEATSPAAPGTSKSASFPRHRAAASLKLTRCPVEGHGQGKFSAASGRGLIEA